MPGQRRARCFLRYQYNARGYTDRFTLFLSIWVETREGLSYANHHLRAAGFSPVNKREAPHLRISRSMVGFTLVGMSLAACAERETEIR